MSDDIDDHEDNSDNIINADDFGGIYITPEDMNPFDGREFYFQDAEGENFEGLDNQEFTKSSSNHEANCEVYEVDSDGEETSRALRMPSGEHFTEEQFRQAFEQAVSANSESG